MADDKEPRWNADPPPGFKPDGSSLIATSDKDVKWPEDKIKVGDKLLTPEEYADLKDDDKGIEDDDDFSDLDDLADL